jgi:hypothetical protein
MKPISEQQLLQLIGFGIKAPSGHNIQPWKFRIGGNTIEIYPDFSRRSPIADPDNRELFISLGCATENICIAATSMKYRAHVDVSEAVITVSFISDPSIAENPLFPLIDTRQTNRSAYNKVLISDKVLEQLAQITNEQGVSCYFYKNGDPCFDQCLSYVNHSTQQLYSNKNFTSELLQWIRFNKTQALRTRDGLTYNTLGSPPVPTFIGKWVASMVMKPAVQVRDYMAKGISSSHIVLFTTSENNISDWVRLGMYLERMLLAMNQAGISYAFLNQPCEIKEFADRMSIELPIDNGIPHILLRIGYAKPASYSPRRLIHEVVS